MQNFCIIFSMIYKLVKVFSQHHATFISPIFSNMLSFMFPNSESAGPIYDVAIISRAMGIGGGK